MLILTSWLQEFVPFNVTTTKLAEDLTLAGLEVEGVESAYQGLSDAVIVLVKTVKEHPGAGHLKICTVNDGRKDIQVVCGAPNVSPNQLAVLAKPGTVLASDEEVKSADIYGVTSAGMLCSKFDLGLGDDHTGIMVVDRSGGLKPGTPLTRALGLDDWVLEIGITPNRPDCLSILGVAREVAAIYGIPLSDSGVTGIESAPAGSNSVACPVTISAPDLCGRYAGAVMEGVSAGPSPYWMARRLRACGIRPINSVVDITNYILLERGQPMHAFDLDRLEGPAIEVRTARKGEKITTIDDVERTLQPEMLVIADAGKPVAVAGIMGGAASGVTDRTSRILLESAWFAPGQVRRTAKALKLPTESSYRFERGIDPEGVITALERAVNLVQDITGATLSGPVIDIYPRPFTPVSIKLRTARAGTVLGCNIKHHEILHILESIGLKITDSRHDSVIGLAPSFRPDLVEEIDLIEEVARLHGYSNIPVRAPVAEITTRPPDNAQILLKKLKTILTSLGMTETISYSFLSPRDIEALCFGDTDPRKRMVRIRNPLSDDQAVMRTSLVASLLKSIGRNHAQRNLDVRLFETGTVFIATEAGRLPVEEHRVAGAWTGSRHIESWAWPENKADLFDLKGVVEGMLSSIGISHWDIQLGTPEDPYFMPGASARILGKDGAVLAVFGQVAPEVEKSYEIKGPVFVFDASVQELLQASSSARRKFQPLARYPSVERDIAVIVEDRVPAKDLLAFIYDKAPDFLENVRIFDVYRGKPVPEGFKSVGLRFRYRAPDHTLSDSHVSEMHNPITESLLKSFNATLRS